MRGKTILSASKMMVHIFLLCCRKNLTEAAWVQQQGAPVLMEWNRDALAAFGNPMRVQKIGDLCLPPESTLILSVCSLCLLPIRSPGEHGALYSNPTVLGELLHSLSRLWFLSRPMDLPCQLPCAVSFILPFHHHVCPGICLGGELQLMLALPT